MVKLIKNYITISKSLRPSYTYNPTERQPTFLSTLPRHAGDRNEVLHLRQVGSHQPLRWGSSKRRGYSFTRGKYPGCHWRIQSVSNDEGLQKPTCYGFVFKQLDKKPLNGCFYYTTKSNVGNFSIFNNLITFKIRNKIIGRLFMKHLWQIGK